MDSIRMDSVKLNDIWSIMSEFTFDIDKGSIKEDMTCIICHKLMIDACHCVCGCQYCWQCISDYLKDGDKYCPGGKDKCNEAYVCMETDVIRNTRINNRILKLRTKCPHNVCQVTVELSQMSEHLKLCTKQSITCPYTSIGCVNDVVTNGTMATHFNNGELNHAHLLVDNIQNLNTQLSDLISKFQLERVRMAEETQIKENRITSLEKELKEFRTENELRTTLVEKIEMKMEGHREEIDNAINDGKMEIKNVRQELCDLKNAINEIKVLTISSNTRINNLIKRNKLCPSIDVDLVWRIDDCSTKLATMRQKYDYSESFYANNYRFCLRLYVHSNGDNITLHCILMRGDRDHKLQWPLPASVTISVIDQDTLLPYKSDTYKYETYKFDKSAFDKPTNERNNLGIGTHPCIIFSSIKDNKSIVFNDSFVVTCEISPL